MRTLLALSLICAVSARADVAAPARVSGGSQAVVRTLDGIVRAKPAGASTWVPLKKGDLLRVGDSVHTSSGARVQFVMKGGGIITIGPLATLIISDPDVPSASAQGGVKTRLKLLVGALYAKVHTEVTKQEFAIEMSGTVAAVKGCEFGLLAEPAAPALQARQARQGNQLDDPDQPIGPLKSLQLVTIEGLVKLSNNLGSQDVRAGFTALVRPGLQPEPPAALDVHHAPLWLGPVVSDNGEQVVKVTVVGADGVSHEVTLRFAKP